ncbi:MAG: divalent-cation tolerance protein CutA [candidate division Zixibacteria bacterium]|nr:divalent-cation tolerance protein CutA [candidate division Zixibacteria bacterium]
MTEEVRIVFVSIPRDEAKPFARALVEERLAACVNIVPKMESFYRWEGKVLSDSEALLMVKTTRDRFDALRQYVEENHPYDLPEIVALPVSEGLPDYLDWIEEETEEEQ